MRLRFVVVVAAWASGILVPARIGLAQQVVPGGTVGQVDPACACFVTEGPGDIPGEDPGDVQAPGSGSDRDRKWAWAGVAGLALLAGLPLGGGSAGGVPFAGGGGESGPLVALDDAPVPQEVPAGARPGLPAPVVPADQPAPLHGDAAPLAGDVMPLPAVEERHGVVPPKTATHLPLLAAAGVAMLGAGVLLSRNRTRERRRRRRFIAL